MLSSKSNRDDALGKRRRAAVSCTECHRRKQKCDRLQPCANCSKREKPQLCIYENLKGGQGTRFQTRGTSMHQPPTVTSLESQLSTPLQAVPSEDSCDKNVSDDLGYSVDSCTGTLELIRLAGAQNDPSSRPYQESKHRDVGLMLQYRNHVRQLPPQHHVEALTRIFFTDIAWYYDIIDEDSFFHQLESWNKVPYSTITQHPSNLALDLLPFPALLFQILAHALLLLPTHAGDSLQDLKHRPDMSFADLAAEYSEIGQGICQSLGTKCTALSKIQAGLLRASFQKSTGSVAEAWHTLGSTIRDAQEAGLHRTRSAHSAVAAMDGSSEHLRDVELRTRLWLVLHLWDGHMAVVLERPMATRVDHQLLISVLDSTGARQSRLSPFAFILQGYRCAYRYLQDIHDLESSGLSQVDKSRIVETVHADIVHNMNHLPDWAKSNSTKSAETAPWLPAAQETLFTEIHFVLLALHRPYTLTVHRSREEAHNAALRILTSQSRLFKMSASREYQPFNLVFATFDAMVLIQANYLLFPHENGSQLDASVNNIQWGLERLDVMRKNNKLAASAYAVVRSLYQKMMSRLYPDPYLATSSDSEVQVPQQAMQGSMACLFADIPQEHVAAADSLGPTSSEQIYAGMQPLQPLHDLIHQSASEYDWQQMQLGVFTTS